MPSSPDGPCYYALLQLTPTAGVQELRQSFRRLSKRYHPDTTLLPADQAQEAFRLLQQAYAVLSDPEARRAYDSQRLARSLPAAVTPAATASRRVVTTTRPLPVRRALSGGEWFALVLLALALLLSMVLGIGVAWARGTELVRQPSWWPQAQAAASIQSLNPAGTTVVNPAANPDATAVPSPAPSSRAAGAAGPASQTSAAFRPGGQAPGPGATPG